MSVRYAAWCAKEGYDIATFNYELLAGFLAMYVMVNGDSSKSVGNVTSLLKRFCIESRMQWLDAADDIRLRSVLAVVKFNDQVDVRRVKPLQLWLLNSWTKEWDTRDYRTLMLLTLLYLGHDGLFRIGELLSGLKVSNVLWEPKGRSFCIKLLRSKANQSGDGELVRICDHAGPSAVKFMRMWLAKRDLMDRGDNDEPLFPALRKTRKERGTVSESWLRLSIKRMVVMNGGKPEQYSGHSLRAGGATDLFVARTPYYLIKKAGRWKSDAAMLYYRCDEDVCKAVAAAFTFMCDDGFED